MALEKLAPVVNKALRTKYKAHVDYCEYNYYYHRRFVRVALELHHIFPGSYRTDEWFNFILITNEIHQRGTHHHLQYGPESNEWNSKFLAIKLIKNELDLNNERQLGFIRTRYDVDEIKRLANEIAGVPRLQ